MQPMRGLVGLAGFAGRGAPAVYPGATLALNFKQQRYEADGARYAFADIPGLSFSRASVGNAVVAGVLTEFASGARRLADNGLLLEETRTNLIRRNTDLSNAIWTKANCTVAADAALAPDGMTTADRVTFAATGAGVFCYLRQAITVTATASYAPSVWMKLPAGGGTKTLYVRKGAQTTFQAVTVTETAWTRFEIEAGAAVVTTHNFDVSPTANQVNNPSAFDVLIWGAQLEAGTGHTSTILTTAASVTRASDQARFASAISGFNASEGAFLIRFRYRAGAGTNATWSNARGAMCMEGDDGVDTYTLQVRNDGSVYYRDAGGTYRTLSPASALSDGDWATVAVSYSASGVVASCNGGAASSNANAWNTGSPGFLNLGYLTNEAQDSLNDHLEYLAYLPSARSAPQLQAMSA